MAVYIKIVLLVVINLTWVIGIVLPQSDEVAAPPEHTKSGVTEHAVSDEKANAEAASELFPQDNSLYVERMSDKIWLYGRNKVLTLVQLNLDPEAREEPLDVAYILFTRKNPKKGYNLELEKTEEILESPYMKDVNTFVLFHDWSQDDEYESMVMIRDALLKDNSDSNVIVVNWADEVFEKSYVTAVRSVPDIAKSVFHFLTRLRKLRGGNIELWHFIGHGMGAHIAGHTARMFESPIGRVTGLDPQGPLFYDSEDVINKNDASYVEIIHTDITKIGFFREGMGHAQFLPNGGRSPQPGCTQSACSHNMAYKLFTATIDTDKRVTANHCKDVWQAMAVRCTGNEVEMGEADPLKRINKHGYYATETQFILVKSIYD